MNFVVLLLMIILPIAACANPKSIVEANHKQSLYDRVISAGKIRCAYIICPPACIKDPNTGKLSGAAIELVELLAKKLGLNVEYTEEVGWSNGLEGLNSNRYDLITTPLWTDANRAKIIGFSKPIWFNAVHAYVRKDDTRFKNQLERINSSDITISTMDGEAGQVIAAMDFPKAKKLALPQTSDPAQLLLNVTTHKADVAFCDPVFAYLFKKNNSDALRILDPKPVRLYSACWTIKRSETEFQSMIDTILDEMLNSGAVDKIIDKYEPAPNTVYRVALPYRK